MYAVIETGGKQYRVELGSELEIDRLDAAPGDDIDLDRVLLVADGDAAQIGRPLVDGALVSASVVRQTRGEKIVVFKYRPKARHRAKHGHRQDLTLVRISDISFGGRSAAQEAEVDVKQAGKARVAAEKEAAQKAAADQALAARLTEAQAEAQPAAKPKSTSRTAKPAATRAAPKRAAKAAPKAAAKATTKMAPKATTKPTAKATAKSTDKAPAKPAAKSAAKAAPAAKSAPKAGAAAEPAAKIRTTDTRPSASRNTRSTSKKGE